jgi:hypothetical protein
MSDASERDGKGVEATTVRRAQLDCPRYSIKLDRLKFFSEHAITPHASGIRPASGAAKFDKVLLVKIERVPTRRCLIPEEANHPFRATAGL